jgi:hypothetical protein
MCAVASAWSIWRILWLRRDPQNVENAFLMCGRRHGINVGRWRKGGGSAERAEFSAVTDVAPDKPWISGVVQDHDNRQYLEIDVASLIRDAEFMNIGIGDGMRERKMASREVGARQHAVRGWHSAASNGMQRPRRSWQRGLADLQILILLGVIFLVPVAITTWFLVQKQRDEIASAEKEIVGAQYTAALRTLSQSAGHHRLAGRRACEVCRRNEKNIVALDALEAQSGAALGSAAGWARVKAAWNRIESGLDKMDANQTRDAYAALEQQWQARWRMSRRAPTCCSIRQIEATIWRV